MRSTTTFRKLTAIVLTGVALAACESDDAVRTITSDSEGIVSDDG